jgi:NDP-4-keto-2,6-dideoxyhexose 3-C-methyltransferase
MAHEHLEFYSFRSLQYLLRTHGLEVFDCELNAINGGSYRVYCRHADSHVGGPVTDWVDRVIREEDGMALDIASTYRKWFKDLTDNRDRCVDFVRRKIAEGLKVWVYGASTKGNVILQWYGLSSREIQGAADRSPEKHGRYTVGTGIPIYSEETFRKSAPHYALVLPYAFIKEFVAREAGWRACGGKFLVPLPEFITVY